MLRSPASVGGVLVAAAVLWIGAGAERSPHAGGHDGQWEIRVDRESRSLSFTATVQARAFRSSLPPDHQYHAIVHRDGGAAGKSLMVTNAPDIEVARALRDLDAQDGGGVPLSAWNLRWVPLVPQPNARVRGTPLEISVHWDGAPRSYLLEELLHDPGGHGAEWRFGGNEEHDDHWHSGCILCLFSCPGGVMSNAAYTIRDHQRAETVFEPGDLLPPDGTEVTITVTLLSG